MSSAPFSFSRLWLTAVGAATLAALWALLPLFFTFSERHDLYYFDLTLQSSAPQESTLQWSRSGEPSATGSVRQRLGGLEKVIRYRYWVAPTGADSLTWSSPGLSQGINLREARLVNDAGKILQHWKAEQLAAARQAERLTLTLAPSIQLEVTGAALLRRLGPGVLSLLVGSLALAWVWQRTGQFIVTRLRRRTEARPWLVLGLVSVAAVALQCHPVVFGGRSFVAPSNGALMLYDRVPTLPTDTARDFADTMGSDIGAMLFQHVHFPRLQAEALFDHGEWPLWNRYNLLGTPLLGQGQTMLGDPLQLPVILARGTAWAWDVRFLVSRWLWAWGLGLAVWLFYRHAGAALLSAALAPFLGYFLFRLNHPALFALGYAPWLLVAWHYWAEADSILKRRRAWLGLTGLTIALLHSGTVKEAGLHLVALHGLGAALFLAHEGTRGRRFRGLWGAAAAGLVALLLSAPLLWPFLRSLGQAVTLSDRVDPVLLQKAHALSFFDEGLARMETAGEWAAGPSLNGVFLAGVLLALTVSSSWILDRRRRVLVFALVLLATFAYGFLPYAWLQALPVVKQIGHVGNTFGCPLLVVLALFAAGGLADLRREGGRTLSYPGIVLAAGLLALGVAGLWTAEGAAHSSAFARGYSVQVVLGAAGVAVAALAFRTRAKTAAVAALVVLLPGLVWRLTQANESRFNHYVFTPGPRADFDVSTPATQALDRLRSEPARVIGLGAALYPGYACALRWESPYGVDPLAFPAYRTLAQVVGLPRVFDWSTEAPAADLAARESVLDLLNIGWAVGAPGEAVPPGWERVFDGDLAVYRRLSAWPRAFYTSSIHLLDTWSQLRDLAQRDRLFAAVERSHAGDLPKLGAGARFAPVPATDYALGFNRTQFRVSAPGPGLLVLQEPLWQGDFHASVNGRPAPLLPVNAIGKAVAVTEAGDYEVEVVYWPRHYGWAWLAAGLGAVVLATGLARGRLFGIEVGAREARS